MTVTVEPTVGSPVIVVLGSLLITQTSAPLWMVISVEVMARTVPVTLLLPVGAAKATLLQPRAATIARERNDLVLMACI